jgi:hypothetical protein
MLGEAKHLTEEVGINRWAIFILFIMIESDIFGDWCAEAL